MKDFPPIRDQKNVDRSREIVICVQPVSCEDTGACLLFSETKMLAYCSHCVYLRGVLEAGFVVTEPRTQKPKYLTVG